MADQDESHIEEAMDTTEDTFMREPPSGPGSPGKPSILIQDTTKEQGDEDKSVLSDSISRSAEVNPGYTMTVVSQRRQANGTIGSVYSGNKIRHLKKDDGIPLWRKDIQYSFLKSVFDDKSPVFTDIDGSKGHTFADIYINTMARSSKTSKVLREKLLNEREPALNMAMICLLVNVGRMNTTLNCKY
jgi:Ino eighty subunit 1